MGIFDHQGFPVLLQVKADLCGGGRIVEQEGIVDDLIQIEKLSDRELIELRHVAEGHAAEPASEQGESE